MINFKEWIGEKKSKHIPLLAGSVLFVPTLHYQKKKIKRIHLQIIVHYYRYTCPHIA